MQAINLANICQSLHCLPRSGGLYDQDYFDALKLQWVIAAQAKKQNADLKRKKKST